MIKNQKKVFLLDLGQILAEVHKSCEQRETKEVKTNQRVPKENHQESHKLLQFVVYSCLSKFVKSKTQHLKRNGFKSQYLKSLKELIHPEQQEVSRMTNELIINFTRLIVLLSDNDWYEAVLDD